MKLVNICAKRVLSFQSESWQHHKKNWISRISKAVYTSIWLTNPSKCEKLKKRNEFCVSTVYVWFVSNFQFHLSVCITSWPRTDISTLSTSQGSHPLGMALVGSARSADRLAPAMMPVTEGKYKPIMFTKLYLSAKQASLQFIRILGFFIGFL